MTTTNKTPRFPKGYSIFQVLLKTNDFLKHPIHFIQKSMDKFGDSYGVTLPDGRKIIWTKNPEFVDYVLRVNQRNFIKSAFSTGRAADFFGNGLVFSTGEYWRRQRRLIQPGFHRQKLLGLYGIIIKTIEEFLAEIPTDQAIDVYPIVNHLSFTVLINSLFDISLSKELLTELNQLFNEIQAFIMDEANKPYKKLFYPITGVEKKQYAKSKRLRAILLDIIKERKSSSNTYTDILDMLLHSTYEDTGEVMTEEQMIDELLILLFAGFETSSNVMSWLLYLLAINKTSKEKLVQSLKGTDTYESVQNEYLKATINEGLRLYPAAWMTERMSVKADTFEGIAIPKDTHIMPFFYGVHRNKKYWNNPDNFQPERFIKDGSLLKSKAFFPFGVGPRMCIGNHFALAEISFFIHAFFEKFDIEATDQVPKMNPLLTLQPDKIMVKIKSRFGG